MGLRTIKSALCVRRAEIGLRQCAMPVNSMNPGYSTFSCLKARHKISSISELKKGKHLDQLCGEENGHAIRTESQCCSHHVKPKTIPLAIPTQPPVIIHPRWPFSRLAGLYSARVLVVTCKKKSQNRESGPDFIGLKQVQTVFKRLPLDKNVAIQFTLTSTPSTPRSYSSCIYTRPSANPGLTSGLPAFFIVSRTWPTTAATSTVIPKPCPSIYNSISALTTPRTYAIPAGGCATTEYTIYATSTSSGWSGVRSSPRLWCLGFGRVDCKVWNAAGT